MQIQGLTSLLSAGIHRGPLSRNVGIPDHSDRTRTVPDRPVVTPFRGTFVLNKTDDGLFQSANGRISLKMDAPGGPMVRVQQKDGSVQEFTAMRMDDNRLLLRGEDGKTYEVDVFRKGDRIALMQPREVQRPEVDSPLSGATRVQVDLEEGRFTSDDGNFRGQFDYVTGRMQGELQIGDQTVGFNGLISQGFVTLDLDDGRSMQLAVQQLRDGSFLVRGLESLGTIEGDAGPAGPQGPFTPQAPSAPVAQPPQGPHMPPTPEPQPPHHHHHHHTSTEHSGPHHAARSHIETLLGEVLRAERS